MFDLGKVLIDFDYSIAARKLAARATMSLPDILKFIDHSPLLFRYETGRMSREEFHAEVSRATGYTGNLAEFASVFADIFSPMEPMIALHAELHRRGVPTFIFSNTNDMAIAHIRRHYPFFAHFNAYVLSYEHGAMKPEARLYEVVEEVTGRRGSRIVYLDDRLENAQAGLARGWQVIHHQSHPATEAALKGFGLLG